MTNLAEYIKTLLDTQGVSVVTVNDGWVFTFTRDHLKEMVETLGDKDSLAVFVKSSVNQPKN